MGGGVGFCTLDRRNTPAHYVHMARIARRPEKQYRIWGVYARQLQHHDDCFQLYFRLSREQCDSLLGRVGPSWQLTSGSPSLHLAICFHSARSFSDSTTYYILHTTQYIFSYWRHRGVVTVRCAQMKNSTWCEMGLRAVRSPWRFVNAQHNEPEEMSNTDSRQWIFSEPGVCSHNVYMLSIFW